ncbi:MAG: hypothetical protein GX897_02285 [Clostridiales bacterium]|nr:hypothetical protein [Clostridiales bacterium]
MRTKVPHNLLTISEMTRRKNNIEVEVLFLEELVLNNELIKKLRASSSMFNKSVYVQIYYEGERYNVARVDRQKNGQYRIGLINKTSSLLLNGQLGEGLDLISKNAI